MSKNVCGGIPDDLWRTPEEMGGWLSQVQNAGNRSKCLLLKLPELEALRQAWPGVARDEKLFNKALSVATAAYQQGVADGLALSQHAADPLAALERAEATVESSHHD